MCICFNMHSPYLWIALVNKDIQSWQFNFFIIYLFISPTVWQSARGSTKKKYKYFYFIHKLWLFVVLLYIYVFSWFPRGAQAHKRKTKGEYLPIDDLLAKRIFDTFEIKLEIYEARNPNIFIFNHMHTYTYTKVWGELSEWSAVLVAGGRAVLHVNSDPIIVSSKSVEQQQQSQQQQQQYEIIKYKN